MKKLDIKYTIRMLKQDSRILREKQLTGDLRQDASFALFLLRRESPKFSEPMTPKLSDHRFNRDNILDFTSSFLVNPSPVIIYA